MIVRMTVQGTQFVETPINKASIILFAFILTSMVLNHNPLPTAMKGIMKHASFILLFFIVSNSNLSESSIKKMVGAIVAIGFVQIPASLIQYYFIYASSAPGWRHDKSAGLLGFNSGAINAVLMTFIFSVVFGFIITYGFKAVYGLAAAVLLIPIILSSARAGFIFFVMTGAFLTMFIPLMEGRKGVRTFRVGLLIVGLVAMVIFQGARGGQISFVTNPSAVYDYSMRGADSGLGRLQSIGFVQKNIGRTVVSSIVGYGPGSITPTKFLGHSGSELYNKFSYLLRHYNSYAYVTLELGYGGLVVFLYVFYRLFSFNRLFYREVGDNFWKAISIGFAGIIFTSIYSVFYTRTWVHPALAFCVWFVGGAICRVAYVRREAGGVIKPERMVRVK